jgi:transposase InsO family protein
MADLILKMQTRPSWLARAAEVESAYPGKKATKSEKKALRAVVLATARHYGGVLPPRYLTEIAKESGVHMRTIKRWVKGEINDMGRPKGSYKLTLDRGDIDHYFREGCSASAMRDFLGRERVLEIGVDDLMTKRTYQRAIKRAVKPEERVAYLKGSKGLWNKAAVFTEFWVEHRNELWQVDNHQFKFLVRSGSKVIKVWGTIVLELYSRGIPAVTLSLYPNSDVVVATIAAAAEGDPRGILPFYGVARETRMDLGRDYTAKHTAAVLAAIGSLTSYCLGYHPWAKGAIERFLRTLVLRLSGRRGSSRGRRDLSGKLKYKFEDLPTYDELAIVIQETIDDYNWQPRKMFGGLSSAQVWLADSTPVETIDDDQIGDMMLRPGEIRVCGTYGIEFFSKHFQSPELMLKRGQSFEVRCRPHDESFIVLYNLDGTRFGRLEETRAGGEVLREADLKGRRDQMRFLGAKAEIHRQRVDELQAEIDAHRRGEPLPPKRKRVANRSRPAHVNREEAAQARSTYASTIAAERKQ